MAVVLLVLCAVILLICFMILRKAFVSNRRRELNFPPFAERALPIFGHTFEVLCNRNRLHQLFTETILGASLKKGNDVVTVRCGTWDIYFIMDPDDGYLLVNSCLKKDLVYGFFKPLLGDEGLITADVPIWKRHRKLINPTFNQSVLETYLVEFNKLSRQLVKDLAREVGKEYFDPISYIKQSVFQIVCATIMGVSIDDKDFSIQNTAKIVETFTTCMVKRLRMFWYHNEYLFNLSNLKKTQYEAAKTLHEVVLKILRKKKAELNKERGINKDALKPRFKAFIDLLLELSEDGALTEFEVQEEVNTFIGAGFDTTTFALAITFLTLGSYPEVQDKVYKELQEVFEETDRDAERQDLSRLKYLEAVVKETMRLYPVVLGIGRTLDKDLSLKNYKLPAGSRCYMSIYNIGRHPMWGPDAEQFRPERWLDGSLPSNSKAYAVFGLGRRSCIGSQYSMMSLKTILSHVLREYRLSGDITQLVQNADVVVTPISGHHISIERR